MTYTLFDVAGIRTAICLPPARKLFRTPPARVGTVEQPARETHYRRRYRALGR